MKEHEHRRSAFRRNLALEDLLKDLNETLGVAELARIEQYEAPRFPMLFIVCPPRAGSTLFTQWLASTAAWAYPTNLLSRFYQAPVIGAMIQEMLTNERFRFRDEIPLLGQSGRFTSALGKTEGLLAPHEFWYFWRRFLPHPETPYLTADEEAGIDTSTLRAELAGMESTLGKPLFFKAIIFNENLPFLARTFPNAFFLHLQRDAFFNAQSLLEARGNQYGDRSQWYSFRLRCQQEIEAMNPIEQVALQVTYLNATIRAGLADLDPARCLHVRYEDFCRGPQTVFDELRAMYSASGVELIAAENEQAPFEPSEQVRLPPDDAELLRSALIKAGDYRFPS